MEKRHELIKELKDKSEQDRQATLIEQAEKQKESKKKEEHENAFNEKVSSSEDLADQF